MTKRRKFSKIFPATITFGDSVIVSETKGGVVYAKCEAQVEMSDGRKVARTVMAFGDQLMSVQPDFAPGNTVKLAVQHDGGTMKVIGYPRDAQPAEDRDAMIEAEIAQAA